jgi:hypothetical protein
VTRLRELAEPRRRAALVCFLWQSYRDAVDQAVDMFDKLLTRAHTQAQNELDEQLCRQRQTIQVSLTALRSLGRIILDDAISDQDIEGQQSACLRALQMLKELNVTGRRKLSYRKMRRPTSYRNALSPSS